MGFTLEEELVASRGPAFDQAGCTVSWSLAADFHEDGGGIPDEGFHLLGCFGGACFFEIHVLVADAVSDFLSLRATFFHFSL